MINRRLNVHLPPCEACSMALHFVNLQVENGTITQIMEITEITQDILRIVRVGFKMDLDESSVHYNRFVTHLRYYLIRQMNDECTDYYIYQDFYDSLKKTYSEEYRIVEKIQEYLKQQKGWCISEPEKMFLLMHLSNLRNKIKENV